MSMAIPQPVKRYTPTEYLRTRARGRLHPRLFHEAKIMAKRNAVIGQSSRPTSVINQSLVGVFHPN
jgi:hypothetical protein